MTTVPKRPVIKKLIPGETLRAEPRSDDEGDDSDADSHGNLRDFVVYDKITSKPVDHKVIDQAWSTWTPKTKGSMRYKNVVNKYSR